MNCTISTTVLALPLAALLTLGAGAAAQAAPQIPALGAAVQPGPLGPGDIANPDDDPEPPVDVPDDFANPPAPPQPPQPPAPQPPAPQPPVEEPAEPVEEEVEETDEEVIEDETEEEDDGDEKESTAAAENGFLASMPLVGLIAGLVALGATIVAVLLARRSRKRTA